MFAEKIVNPRRRSDVETVVADVIDHSDNLVPVARAFSPTQPIRRPIAD